MSDIFARNLTITLLVIMIMYYKYVRFIINQKGDYNQNKCDPINMIIGGITGVASDDLFKQCASGVTDDVIDSEFNTYAKNVNKEVTLTQEEYAALANGATSNIDSSTQAYLDKQKKQELEQQVMKEVTEATSEAIAGSSNVLSNTMTTLNQITSKISEAAKNFVNTDAIKKI